MTGTQKRSLEFLNKSILLLLPLAFLACEGASDTPPNSLLPGSHTVTPVDPTRLAPFNPAVGNPPVTRAPSTFTGQRFVEGDFDGDFKADFATFESPSRVNVCTWRIVYSGGAEALVRSFGASFTDKIIKGDFDGDGKADLAVVRGGGLALEWRILRSSNDTIQIVEFGGPSDRPVPADYDGDGTTDIAVFRFSSGQWLIRNSQNLSVRTTDYIGDMTSYSPVPADYDGDGKADLAVVNPQAMQWSILPSRTSVMVQTTFGTEGDVPLPADFDGDGKAELAVHRLATGQWIFWHSTSGLQTTVAFGTPGARNEVPVVGDFDGDGSSEIALYDYNTGSWNLRSVIHPTDVFADFSSDPNGGLPVLMRP